MPKPGRRGLSAAGAGKQLEDGAEKQLEDTLTEASAENEKKRKKGKSVIQTDRWPRHVQRKGST